MKIGVISSILVDNEYQLSSIYMFTYNKNYKKKNLDYNMYTGPVQANFYM